MKNKRGGLRNMTTGSPAGHILSFALPLLAGNQAVFGPEAVGKKPAAKNFVVAKAGEPKLTQFVFILG